MFLASRRAPQESPLAARCRNVHAPVNQPTPVILVAYLARCRVHSARNCQRQPNQLTRRHHPSCPPPPLPPPEPLLSANSAPTFVSAVTRISQEDSDPLHAPDHPENVLPAAETSVSVRVAPGSTGSEQSGAQLSKPLLALTVPLPEPERVTLTRGLGRNVTDIVLELSMYRLQILPGPTQVPTPAVDVSVGCGYGRKRGERPRIPRQGAGGSAIEILAHPSPTIARYPSRQSSAPALASTPAQPLHSCRRSSSQRTSSW